MFESIIIMNPSAAFPQQEPEDQEYFSRFVTLSVVRISIHVGNLTFHDGSEVEKHLLQDVMKSIKPWLGILMDNYRVRRYEAVVFLLHNEPHNNGPCFCIVIVPGEQQSWLPFQSYSLQSVIVRQDISHVVCVCIGADVQWAAGCDSGSSTDWTLPTHSELDWGRCL